MRSPIPIMPDLETALEGVDVLLSGTGWGSDLEHFARKLARQARIRSFAVLDHWVNYPDRFTRNGEVILPDEIFVTDEYSRHEAESCFRGTPVRIYNNLYLAEQLRQIPPLDDTANEVLYLLEPIRANWSRNGVGEFEALDFFMTHWARLGIPEDTLMRLRPHPSDPYGKYCKWIAAHASINVKLDENLNLALAIARARWVAGCETNALTIALAAGRTVISTLPPWAPACRLPHEGLVHLGRMA